VKDKSKGLNAKTQGKTNRRKNLPYLISRRYQVILRNKRRFITTILGRLHRENGWKNETIQTAALDYE
jgi:hypothetical protein